LFKAINYATSVHPVTIQDKIMEVEYECLNMKQVEDTLKGIFSSEELKDIIQNLLAQIDDNVSDF